MSQGTPGKRRSKHARRPKGPPPIVVDETMAGRIKRGAKTQHRYGSDKACKHHVHDLVAVHRKGVDPKKADPLVCHVAITAVYNQLPGDISDVEAKAEGFKDRAEFHAARRFRCRQVWVLTFEWAETPRYMNENPGMARSDYTVSSTDALDRDAPAPDDDTIREFAKHNAKRHEANRRAEREGLPLHIRVADLERLAAAGDRMAKREVFVIQRRVEASERRAERGGEEKAA